jgi:hypothetical protein
MAHNRQQTETALLCITCGTQFAPSEEPPAECRVCKDPRQYVGWNGQQWTTSFELAKAHSNIIRREEEGLYSIHTNPGFGIGQRAFLLQTKAGNVLWDCVSLLDEPTIASIKALGGISAIAISHPHYYISMVEWSLAFGDAPIYLHAADRQWIMRPDDGVLFWQGLTQAVLNGPVLINTPGHFEGFQVLYWPDGADGKGVLLSGDQPQVCPDRNWVSFMYSYPNYIPLGKTAVERIVALLKPFRFDRIYGAFPHQLVAQDAKEVISRSADRFIRLISE